jgi:uncharacterized protein YuzE
MIAAMSVPRIEYDSEADAAYIYLKVEPALGHQVARTVCVDPLEMNGMVNLDLDDEGRIIGIEVMDASKKLSAELLPD